MYLHSTDIITGYCICSQHKHCCMWLSDYRTEKRFFSQFYKFVLRVNRDWSLSPSFFFSPPFLFWDHITIAESKAVFNHKFWCFEWQKTVWVWVCEWAVLAQLVWETFPCGLQPEKALKNKNHRAPLRKFLEVFNWSKITFKFPLLGKHPLSTSPLNWRSCQLLLKMERLSVFLSQETLLKLCILIPGQFNTKPHFHRE